MSPNVYGFSDLFIALRGLVIGLIGVWIPCGGMIFLLSQTDASGAPLGIALFALVGLLFTFGIGHLCGQEVWGALKCWGERRYYLQGDRRVYYDET